MPKYGGAEEMVHSNSCIFAPANLYGKIRPIMQRTLLVVTGICLAAITVLTSCSRKSVSSATGATGTGQVTVPGPPCVVYRTRADFSTLIPVELTDDKTQLASFPDVKDIYRDGVLAYPTPLDGGYMLDNRGIGPNVAFLNLTYEDYRKLDKTPTASDLMNAIIDRDPLLELYQCGNRSQYKDVVSELNLMISSGKLAGCRKLK
jgi:hypothetical protein